MYSFKPLGFLLSELNMFHSTSKTDSIYTESLGPSNLAWISVEPVVHEDMRKEFPFEVILYTKIPLPSFLVVFDEEGITALLKEYKRALLVARGLSKEHATPVYDDMMLNQLEERERFHVDFVDLLSIRASSADEVIEILRDARRLMGLGEPVSMIDLSDNERRVYMEVARQVMRGLIDIVVAGAQPNRAKGTVTVERISSKLGLGGGEAKNLLEQLVSKGFITRVGDNSYKAKLATGAFAEALSLTDDHYACLAWPYSLGFTHREWRVFYEGEEECMEMSMQLAKLEEEGLLDPSQI